MNFTNKELEAMEKLIQSRRGKAGAKKRWADKTKEQKREHAMKMVAARVAKKQEADIGIVDN